MSGGGGWWQKGMQSFGVTAGAISKNIGERKSAEQLRQASLQSDQILKDSAAQQQGFYSPYSDAGSAALPQLTDIATRQQTPFAYRDSSNFLNDYFNSPEYKTLNAQAQDQILRGASATGGLRSGGSNVGLAQIAPTIGIDALNRVNQQDLNQFQVNQGADTNRYNQLMGISSLGLNAAGQRSDIAGTEGTNLSKGAMFRGGAKANMLQKYYGNLGQMHEDLAAIWGN